MLIARVCLHLTKAKKSDLTSEGNLHLFHFPSKIGTKAIWKRIRFYFLPSILLDVNLHQSICYSLSLSEDRTTEDKVTAHTVQHNYDPNFAEKEAVSRRVLVVSAKISLIHDATQRCTGNAATGILHHNDML